MDSLKVRRQKAALKEQRQFTAIFNKVSKNYSARQLNLLIKQGRAIGAGKYNRRTRLYETESKAPTTKHEKGRLIAQAFVAPFQNRKIVGVQSDMYKHFHAKALAQQMARANPKQMQLIAKYGTKPSKATIAKMSEGEFKRYQAARKTMATLLGRADKKMYTKKIKTAGSLSKWQEIIDELEDLLRESPKG